MLLCCILDVYLSFLFVCTESLTLVSDPTSRRFIRWLLFQTFIYIKNCWVKLLSNYNIKYICTIYTRLDTCLMSISRFSLRDKVTLRLLKLHFYGANVVESAGRKAKRLLLQCINGVNSNPEEGRTKLCQIKDLILTLFGLIFRRI